MSKKKRIGNKGKGGRRKESPKPSECGVRSAEWIQNPSVFALLRRDKQSIRLRLTSARQAVQTQIRAAKTRVQRAKSRVWSVKIKPELNLIKAELNQIKPLTPGIFQMSLQRLIEARESMARRRRRGFPLALSSVALIIRRVLDIKLIREKPDFVRQRLATRGAGDEALVEKILQSDEQRRKLLAEVETLKSQRNRVSKEIGALMGQKKIAEAEAKKTETRDLG